MPAMRKDIGVGKDVLTKLNELLSIAVRGRSGAIKYTSKRRDGSLRTSIMFPRRKDCFVCPSKLLLGNLLEIVDQKVATMPN